MNFAAMHLNKKPQVWGDFYNLNRSHASLGGKLPYEVLKEKLTTGQNVWHEI